MKKSTNGIKKVLMIGAVGPDGWSDKLCATPTECEAIAKRLDIPAVNSLEASVRVDLDNDLIRVTGHLTSQLTRQCVVSLDLFPETVDTEFEALFAQDVQVSGKETEMKEAIEPLERGCLDFFEILTEQVGLFMNPFPRKPDVSGNYVEFSSNQGHKPFADLKKMIKKD